jgi:hypothetical protein
MDLLQGILSGTRLASAHGKEVACRRRFERAVGECRPTDSSCLERVAEIDALLDHHCDREIAEILNNRGRRTWEGKPFNLKKIAFIRFAYKLPSRFERLRRRGMLTTREVAERFKISQTAVYDWGRQGLIKKCYSDTLNRGLWEVQSGKTIIKGCGGRGARPARLTAISASSPE